MDDKTFATQLYTGLANLFKALGAFAVVLGLLLLVRIIFLFFGSLKTFVGYEQVLGWTTPVVAPLEKLGTVKTPYEGKFDIAATVVLVLVLLGEFVLSSIQRFFRQRAKMAGTTQPPATPLPDESATPPTATP